MIPVRIMKLRDLYARAFKSSSLEALQTSEVSAKLLHFQQHFGMLCANVFRNSLIMVTSSTT
jgi:hypothetical protein